MAIYRADQAVVTFAAEAGQGGYPESGTIGTPSSTNPGVTTVAINPGDRTVTASVAFSGTAIQGGAFIVVGNSYVGVASPSTNAPKGPREIRKVVAGLGTTNMTVDAPFAFSHAVGAATGYTTSATEGNADTVLAEDGTAVKAGKYITYLPGVYETVDVPDPEQAFEPRYMLGSLTNRNFYEMYKGQETLAGSIGSMILLNGFPLRFPLGTVQTLPHHLAHLNGAATGGNFVGHDIGNSGGAWILNGATKKGDVYISVDKAGGSNDALPRGPYLAFGFASDATQSSIQTICDGGFDQFTSSTNYEVRQVVSNHTGATAYSIQLNAPLHFDHADNEKIATVSSASDATGLSANGAFIHKIQEATSLDSVSWNVAIPDSDGLNTWQRRYIGGKIGSMSLSAEEGGLLTAGWDGVQFLDMVHNVKTHYNLATDNKRMPRYTAMHEMSASNVGRAVQATDSDSITYSRPDTSPYYFSNGTVQLYGTGGNETVARVRSFGLNVSNGEEPRYYIRKQYEGRRSPFEIFEGNREYTMSATIVTPDATSPGAANSSTDTLDLWRELLLAGDYRGSGTSTGMRGFGIRLTFSRDGANGETSDYIRVTIPNDGTAASGGNEQGAFIRTAPHNIGTDNPIQADADIQFRSMKIEIRDGEPMYP